MELVRLMHLPAHTSCRRDASAAAFDCLALTSRAAADVELVRLLHLPAHTTPAADATPVRRLAVAFDCLALTSRAAADVALVRLLHRRREVGAAARFHMHAIAVTSGSASRRTTNSDAVWPYG